MATTDKDQSDAATAATCPIPSRSFEPLGEFKFWGKLMNASSPCPTAGMNNQLMMLLGLLRCSADRNAKQQSRQQVALKWKDISCSPTGGKDKPGGKFAVGGADYEYAWFRWSEVFDAAPDLLCLSDTYSWSESGPWMKKCPTTVDHFYGTARYWEVRKALTIKSHYYCLAADVLKRHGLELGGGNNNNNDDDGEGSSASSSSSSSLPRQGRFLAIHVRRGDYHHFCVGTAKTSGVSKFRTPPYKWLKGNTTSLSSKFMHSCAPSNELIAQHVRSIVKASKDAGQQQEPIKHLVVASNSAEFVAAMRKGTLEVIASGETVRSLNSKIQDSESDDDTASSSDKKRILAPSYWPRKYLTATDLAMLDIVILSLAEYIVLNKYSTFSQSAIDFRVLRNQNLDGVKIHWW